MSVVRFAIKRCRGLLRAVFVNLFALLVSACLTQMAIAQASPLSEGYPAVLPGDLIFKPASTAFWTQIAAEYSNGDKRWGHIGVVTRVDSHGLWITHADMGQLDQIGLVVEQPLEQFIGQAEMIGHFRINLTEPQTRVFLAALASASEDRVPFDRGYDLTSANNAYCTELVWRAWKDAIGREPIAVKSSAFGKPYIALSDISLHPEVFEVQTLPSAEILSRIADKK